MADSYKDKLNNLKCNMGELGSCIPDIMQGFGAMHKTQQKEGALDFKQKELIALAIGIAVRCEGCIIAHTKAALDAGATADEIEDVIGVAIFMGGGPAVVYGCIARDVLKEFSE